jgi:hypothetical protein
MRLTKDQEVEYREVLVNSREEMFGIALAALLNSDIERVKDMLCVPDGGNVPALQGEAQAYKKILKYLKERPGTTKQV